MENDQDKSQSCNLLTEFTKAAHNLNFTYSRVKGLPTQTVWGWEGLSDQEKKEKIDTFDRMATFHKENNYSPSELHEVWLKTAPADHPCNVPYDELNDGQKNKDILFLGLLELFNTLS